MSGGIRSGHANIGLGEIGRPLSELRPREVQDTAEVIEWIAGQPWCDGKVGMFGSQPLPWHSSSGRTQAPPPQSHLYTLWIYGFLPGQVLSRRILSHAFMQGWTTTIDNMRYESWCMEKWGKDRYQEAIAQTLQDRISARSPIWSRP